VGSGREGRLGCRRLPVLGSQASGLVRVLGKRLGFLVWSKDVPPGRRSASCQVPVLQKWTDTYRLYRLT
jgi:hypothetical protein